MQILNNETELEQAVQSGGLLLVQFGAETCAPCTAIRQKIETWQAEHQAVRFLYIPTEHFRELCAQEGVFTVPTIFVYAEGRLTLRESGYFGLNALLQKVERYETMLLHQS